MNFFNTSQSHFMASDPSHSLGDSFSGIKPLTSVTEVTTNEACATLPALFVSHGTPSLAIENNASTRALARIGQNLPKPKAIIIMSAHWVSHSLEVASNPNPHTWHDFSGFSSKLRELSYPAVGATTLAESLSQQLVAIGVPNSLNPIRPLDHGVWAPLVHLYPDADVPLIQLSLPKFFDAYACYQLGHLFRQLRREQILIVGSGSVTHNLGAMRWHADTQDAKAVAFKGWLLKQLKTDIPSALDWQQYSGFQNVHPSSEHILPLFFALGTGQRVSVVHESMEHHSLGMDIYRFD